jgi:hypothetical protein
MKKYLLSEADRRELVRVLERERSSPPVNQIRERAQFKVQEGDTYWALPPCETGLPGKDRITGEAIGIQCCLFTRDRETDELRQLFDNVGHPQRVTVFNFYTWPENNLVQIYHQKDGTWTNEKPSEPRKTSDAVGNQPAGSTLPPSPAGCEGECFWQADSNGVWLEPTGGCQNGTSTTTSTNPPDVNHPGTTTNPTRYPDVELFSCSKTKCLLVCKAVVTTPNPGTTAIPPPPTVKYRYELDEESTECPEGCTCYGLGDPCYLVEGVLESQCIGSGPSTTSTTTPDPYESSGCEQAEFIFGTVPPAYARKAIKQEIGATWESCTVCDEANGFSPLFPTGDFYRRHEWRRLATVYETPCVANPCFAKDNSPIKGYKAVYRAYPWEQQIALWGWQVPGVFNDRPNKRFIANWFACSECEADNTRAWSTPPFWIYPENIPNGITPDRFIEDPMQPETYTDPRDGLEYASFIIYDEATNTYVYYTACGPSDLLTCDLCSRAPTRRKWEYQGPPDLNPNPTTTGSPADPTSSTTSTTTSTTTPVPNCGCVRPNYCPQPFECVRTACNRSGLGVFPAYPSATTVPPPNSLPCFPTNTTTSGPTSSTSPPSTTNGPNQCIGSDGSLCICPTTIPPGTQPPSGGTCPPGFRRVLTFSDEDSSCFVYVCRPFGNDTGSTRPPGPCVGACIWESRWTYFDGPENEPLWSGWVYKGGIPPIVYSEHPCRPGGAIYNFGAPVGNRPGDPNCRVGEFCCCPFPEYIPPMPENSEGICFYGQLTYCNQDGGGGPDRPTTTLPPCACCSTTPNPCLTGSCRYTANSVGGWTLRTNTCQTGCSCPAASSITIISEPCDVLNLPCGGSPPTQPPTTSSTTTSTTTPNPGACCILTSNGGSFCSFVNNAEECEFARANLVGGQGESAAFYPGLTCDEVDCLAPPTTLPPAGSCCYFQLVGSTLEQACVSSTEEECINQIAGTFSMLDCAQRICGGATSTTTTTTAPTSTTTTTNNPTAACCWTNGPFPVCAANFGSSECIAQGGSVVADCGSCTGSTTTTTTTTTTTGGVGTTPSPEEPEEPEGN